MLLLPRGVCAVPAALAPSWAMLGGTVQISPNTNTKKKGYEDTAENQNTLQAFWLGGQSSFGGRGMLWWGAEAQGSAEC